MHPDSGGKPKRAGREASRKGRPATARSVHISKSLSSPQSVSSLSPFSVLSDCGLPVNALLLGPHDLLQPHDDLRVLPRLIGPLAEIVIEIREEQWIDFRVLSSIGPVGCISEQFPVSLSNRPLRFLASSQEPKEGIVGTSRRIGFDDRP